MDQKDPTIDTIMYLRDGAPRATVCKLQLKDGRIGIGVWRWEVSDPPPQEGLDALAFEQAVWALPAPPPPPEEEEADDDLQAKLGHPAHE